MRPTTVILLAILISACKNNKTNQHENTRGFSFFVGTYTDGTSQGIYNYNLNYDGTLEMIGLAAKSENPSFLAVSYNKKYLLAVNEIADSNGCGSIESYAIGADSLLFLSRSSSGGAHPCFVAVNNIGQVLVANYTGGNVGFLQLNSQGMLSNLLDKEQHTGKGTTDRQEGPHAHSAWFAPDKSIISVDLGTNELWFSKIDTNTKKITPCTPQKLAMANGAGPRHLAFHPNKKWIYVLNELDNTVTMVAHNKNGMYQIETSISTLPDGFAEFSKAADIHISSDGKFVYASNRGHNSIAIFKVNNQTGTLSLAHHESTHGDTPRNFAFSPDEDYLLVANQNSNNIIAFKRHKTTGLLKFVSQIDAPSPVCILFK